jgi:ubiquinone/menaquinone biosynthesis C-methylase UbiE
MQIRTQWLLQNLTKRSFSEKRTFSKLIAKDVPMVPKYLEETYWWAYTHPNAVWVFEREWLVNAILWGNFKRLRDETLKQLTTSGKTLQVACVYGDFSQKLCAQHIQPEDQVHIVDIAPVQISNIQSKVKEYENVYIHQQDSSLLTFPENSFDNVVVFFLLHEQPLEVRAKTVAEAIRVAKAGTKVIFTDYHRPASWNPFKYIMYPVLRILEPFALDLWDTEIKQWLPEVKSVTKKTYFGGLYQQVIVIK